MAAPVTLKRRIADGVGRLLGVQIVRKDEVFRLAQRSALERTMQQLGFDCVFDVGGNEGQFAHAVRAAGFQGPIISFEPIPVLAASLRKQALRDPFWFVEEIALHDAERSAEFHIAAEKSCSTLLTPLDTPSPYHRITETIGVTTATLDGFFDRYRERLGFKRPFLKIDAEGVDVAIAKGAGTRLREFVGVQSELLFDRLWQGQDDCCAIVQFYRDSGFTPACFVSTGYGAKWVDCIMINRCLNPVDD
jgi:FkbM family methyltransferase